MPIHFDDRDVDSEVAGLSSALIVPCYMCPAITVSIREEKPFIQLFRHFLKSASFEKYISRMQCRLEEQGVRTEVFKSAPSHEWFMCMWTSGKRKRLQKASERCDAVIVLGCDSATETARDASQQNGCKVVEGMQVAGIMNAQIRFRFPGDISFENCRTVSIDHDEKDDETWEVARH